MKKEIALLTSLFLGFTLMFAGSAHAAATVNWGAWTMYGQEKSNWCWAAATKSLIKKARGTTVSQCNIVKAGKGTSSCANVAGTKSNYSRALSKYGVTPYTYSSGRPSWTKIRSLTQSGKGAIQDIKWVGNAGTGHAMPLIGTKNDRKQVYVARIGVNSVKGQWITYGQFTAGTAGQNSPYESIRGWTHN